MGRIEYLRLLLVMSGICALVLTCSSVATLVTWEVKERNVNANWKTEIIKLSLDNAEEAFTKGERWLVQVYSRRCIHCQRFVSQYEEIRKKLVSSYVQVAKLEGRESVILLKRLQIKAYPTFVLVDEDNNVYQFSGSRSVDNLVLFANEKKNSNLIHDVWWGPNSPFWSVVIPIANKVQRLIERINAGELSRTKIGIAAAAIGFGMISIFILALHITTTPPKLRKE
uniref:Thioredoxin domain-containing protein n=1 Tax=Rhodosorus marinus TaxID=101924 RepID=A0A7S0BQ60_9RHOD|mmetsp:Transcript_4212/g.5990  ORF Transcript_4212/g.5990 Transcript_4212/m.5990 type:complete len:226 (+) Transcript_4212:265-942(+)